MAQGEQKVLNLRQSVTEWGYCGAEWEQLDENQEQNGSDKWKWGLH